MLVEDLSEAECVIRIGTPSNCEFPVPTGGRGVVIQTVSQFQDGSTDFVARYAARRFQTSKVRLLLLVFSEKGGGGNLLCSARAPRGCSAWEGCCIMTTVGRAILVDGSDPVCFPAVPAVGVETPRSRHLSGGAHADF